MLVSFCSKPTSYPRRSIQLLGVAVTIRVAGEYHDALSRGLLYPRMAEAPFLVHVEEFHVILLGYVIEKTLSSFFVKIEIALIIS